MPEDRPTPLVRRPPVAGGTDVRLPGAGGTTLAATRWDGAGPPVVLLHGLASQRRFWDLVVPRLPGLALLALDARGHGDSDQPPTGYDTATAVADLEAALAAWASGPAVLVGHSWGAVVALSFAAARADRVAAVVAIDGGLGAPGDQSTPREELRHRLEPPQLAVPPDELRAMLRHSPLGPWWSPDVEAAVLPIFGLGPDGLARARFPFELHMQVVDALLDYDAAEVLSALRCPAWLVSCEPVRAEASDEWSLAWARRKEAGLERAAHLLESPRLLRWAGALHDVPLQWPALVAGLVRAAVDEAAAGPAGRREGVR